MQLLSRNSKPDFELNSVISRLQIVLTLFLFISVNISCKQVEKGEVDYTYLLEDVDIPEKLVSHDHARQIIRKYGKDYPIPENYIIPDYLKQDITVDSAYQVFYARYPGFYGKQGIDFLNAIIANPQGYYIMVTENKALRNKYEAVVKARKEQQDREYMEQQAREAQKVIEEFEKKKAQDSDKEQ